MTNFQNPMIDNTDPRLTAYVLGELAPAEVAQIEAALKSSPELQTVVADIRQASETISNVYLGEPSLQLTSEQKSQLLSEAKSASNFDVHSNNVTPSVGSKHEPSSSASHAHWLKIAIVAGLTSVLIGGAYFFSRNGIEPMAANDRAVFDKAVQAGTEPMADEETMNEELEAAKGLTPLKKQAESQALKVEAEESATVAGDAAPLLLSIERNADKPSKLLANPARDITKADAADRMRPKTAMAPKPVTMPRVETFEADGKTVPESFPDPFFLKPGAESNLNQLASAQKSLDQSVLSSLNLTVVAQSPGNSFAGIGGRAGFDPSAPLNRSVLSPPAEDQIAKERFRGSVGATTKLPTALALRISDQEAKQIVALLARQVDPQQQRKLSFNDLIGPPTLKFADKGVKRQPGSSNSEGKPEADRKEKTLLDKSERLGNPPELMQHVAAATLAKKLRDFIDQPSLTSRASKANSIASNTAADGIAVSQNSLRSQAAPAMQAQQGAPMAEPNMAGRKADPESVTKGNYRGLLGTKPKSGRLNPQQPLSEFDFDFSQVIQQLKLNLKTRNESLPDLK